MTLKQCIKAAAAVLVLGTACLIVTGRNAGGGQRLAVKTAEAATVEKQTDAYMETEQKLGTFHSIQADLGCTDLQIKLSDRSQGYLSYKLYSYDGKNPFQWDIKNGILTIKETGFSPAMHKKGLSWTNAAAVTLYVPAGTIQGKEPEKGFLESVNVVVESGDIHLSKLTLLEALNVRTKEGDVRAADCAISGSTDVHTQEGDISIAGDSFSGNVKLCAKEGDVNVSVPESGYKPLNIDASTEEGEISVKKSIGGKKDYKNDKEHYVKTAEKSNIRLDITTGNGDIYLR